MVHRGIGQGRRSFFIFQTTLPLTANDINNETEQTVEHARDTEDAPDDATQSDEELPVGPVDLPHTDHKGGQVVLHEDAGVAMATSGVVDVSVLFCDSKLVCVHVCPICTHQCGHNLHEVLESVVIKFCVDL